MADRHDQPAAQDHPSGGQWAHPCGCFLFNGALDFCQHGNRYEHRDPPDTDPATKMLRLQGWLASKGIG